MKKMVALLLTLVLALALTACDGGAKPVDGNKTTGEAVTLKVAASPTPHAEILAQVKDVLAEQGITLEVSEYGDYKSPNTVLEEGEVDANFFQHKPHMETSNKEDGTHLVSVATIHYEPMGVYAGKTKTLKDLANGAVIAVPNDSTNEARALQLLAKQGIIEISADAGLNATPNDITKNPKNITFKEMEAAMLPQIIEEVNLSVINSNFAMQGGLNPAKDALVTEDVKSESAQTYANIIAVKEGNEKNKAVLALVEALRSDAVREFINKTYSGAVVPMF